MKKNTWRRRFFFIAVVFSISVCSALLYLGGVVHGRKLVRSHTTFGDETHFILGATDRRVMPGEFERHDALLVTWPSRNHPFILAQPESRRGTVLAALNRLYVQIIATTHEKLKVICLISDEGARAEVRQILQRAGLPINAVQLLRMPAVDLWTRDFGPVITKTSGGSCIMIGGNYLTAGRLAASQRVAGFLASRFKLPLEELKINFEGGNLLSNGAGLCITTKMLADWNRKGYSPTSMEELVRQRFGASQVLFLDPLSRENTGHIDMQATFTAPDTVVVGEVSADVDPVNAKILNENARRLAQVVTPCGRLHVHRVPLLAGGEGEWLSYTNVIYANGALLVPRYSQVDPKLQQNVLKTYQTLLPSWQVVQVDADVLSLHKGSLHCAVLNLFRILRVQ